MSIRTTLLLALCAGLLDPGAAAQSQRNQPDRMIASLAVGKPLEREIASDEVHLYGIELNTGDFARGFVDQRGITIRVRGLFPDGSKIRQFNGPPTGRRAFRFVAEAPGIYQLELRPVQARAQGSYQISLDQIQPMSERLKIAPEEFDHSPRVQALSAELATAHHDALGKFWQDILHEGTPFVEPIPGDDKNLLVTFLWRATFETYNVLIMWAPFTSRQPDDHRMTHLGGTDVWYKTLRLPKGARFVYQLSPNDTLTRAANAQRYATAQLDPLNPRREPDNPNLAKYETYSIAELPGAPPQPWIEKRPGVPSGAVTKHRFRSGILNNERDVFVYTPPGYRAGGGSYGLVVLFDGTTYLNDVPAPTVLDNLIAERKMDPAIAVLIDYAKPDDRGAELGCNPQFAELLRTELMPWVRERYDVTHDPARSTVGGLSMGGLAAAYIGLKLPDLFGNVMSQSGALWWAPNVEHGEERGWLGRQYIDAPRLPLRFYLEAGLFEIDTRGVGGQILETTRHLRDILRAKGYDVSYHEFVGGHDRVSWRGTLADGLIALMGRSGSRHETDARDARRKSSVATGVYGAPRSDSR